MADVALSALPAASTLDGTEVVPVVQGGTTKKTTPVALTAAEAVARDAADVAHAADADPHPGYTTTAELAAAVAALVNAAPGALDTLKELADALGGDANFATTVTNALAAKETPAGAQSKADTAQAFAIQRGNHTGTQAASTITTTVRTVTAATTITSADGVVLLNAQGGAIAQPLPTAVGFTGAFTLVAIAANTNVVTLSTTGGQTVSGAAPPTLGTVASGAPYTSVTLVSDGANWWIV